MSERLIPETWFRAQSRSTTMAVLNAKHMRRDFPLVEGERALGVFVLPPFQRPAVWTQAQQARFVESCWLGLPIGMFVVNRTDNDGPLDAWLLDGQQRVTAVYAYMADEFPVFGHLFSELPASDLRKWSMSVGFPCAETSLTSVEECREVYDRLAYGGTAHPTPTQEASRHG